MHEWSEEADHHVCSECEPCGIVLLGNEHHEGEIGIQKCMDRTESEIQSNQKSLLTWSINRWLFFNKIWRSAFWTASLVWRIFFTNASCKWWTAALYAWIFSWYPCSFAKIIHPSFSNMALCHMCKAWKVCNGDSAWTVFGDVWKIGEQFWSCWYI